MSRRPIGIFGNASGSGGNSVPTASWTEDIQSDDSINSLLISNLEDVNIDDAFAYLIVKEGEDVNNDDAWSQFILSAYGEDVNNNDLTKIQLLTVDVARTGTPDSDLMFDAYTNQLAAFAATNFGNASLQCRGVTTTPGADEQRAYIAIDLTGYSGFTGLDLLASNSRAFEVTVQAANSNLLTATTLSCAFRVVSTKPFTESTVTWNSPPTLGSTVVTPTQSIAAGGGFASYVFGATASAMSTAWGNWLLLVFTGPGAATTALVDTFTIKSRDDATASNRPKFSLAVQRGT